MIRIYVLRHGETEWNRLGRLQGTLNSPLTPKGETQAKKMAEILRRETEGKPIPRVVSSPLGRACQTAEIVSNVLKIPFSLDARLAEVNMGDWNGHIYKEIKLRWPEAFLDAGDADWNFFSSTGENYDTVRNRVATWLSEQHSDVIAVGHGLSGKLLRGAYLGLPYAATLALTEPQDSVFCLHDGQMDLLR